MRFEPDGQVTVMGGYGVAHSRPGWRGTLDPRLALASVQATGRAARRDTDDPPVTAPEGVRGAVASPIVVEGRLWGAIAAGSRRGRLPADTEQRLADFTELVATAIANAESQAELTTSRARIVAAADQARRRIERDLHDGAQQRLVSLALQLRAARAAVPPGLGDLGADLDRAAAAATGALDELRDTARGIHPAILAEGGLRPALAMLARRSPVPVELQVGAGGRLPEQVEVSAYYVVAEALTNAAKHARASAVSVQSRSPGTSCASRSATTAPAAPASAAAPAWPASRTAWRRSAAGSSSTARAGRAPPCAWNSRSPHQRQRLRRQHR